MSRLTGLKKLDLHNPSSWDEAGFGKGDIVHVETPLNPTGEAYNLEYFAEEVHKRGGYLTVDATLGPPTLQDPFKHGADIVLHSGTKYIGGHSDMLCGILATQRKDWWQGLYEDRLHLGAVMGNLEGWLGLRSLRTLELRVKRQAENSENLVQWLDTAMQGYSSKEQTEIVQKGVLKVQHASLQRADVAWLRKQMSGGFGPVFAITMKNREMARRLPSKLRLFHHATSLAGVESLIEWRRMSDDGVDDRLLRVSVGIEDYKDLKADLLQAIQKVVQECS